MSIFIFSMFIVGTRHNLRSQTYRQGSPPTTPSPRSRGARPAKGARAPAATFHNRQG